MSAWISAIASLAGSGDSGQGQGSDYSGGIGENLLGAPGDPAGTMTNLLGEIYTKKEQKRQFEEQLKLQKQMFGENDRKRNLMTAWSRQMGA